MNFLRRRSLRWALPVAAIAATVGFASVSNLVSADAQVPNLPPLTAAELLSKVASAKVPAFSGSVQLTTNLGLPDLGGFGGSVPASLLQLLSGSHTASVASDGSTKVRVTMHGPLAESSWIRNGNEAWAWNSETQTATHASTAAIATKGTETDEPASTAGGVASGVDSMSPPALAASVLAQVDPTTVVSVRTSAYVAGRAAYELVLAPKSAQSTVGEIVLAIDAATGTPLDARIVAKGQSAPALELGFTQITFATPAASTFVFSPPTGVAVKEVASVTDLLPVGGGRHEHDRATATVPDPAGSTGTGTGAGGSTTVGTMWDSVVVMKGSTISPQIAQLLGGAKTVTLANGVTAKVVSTSLINAIVASDGRIAVGAVTPQALQAALSQPAA